MEPSWPKRLGKIVEQLPWSLLKIDVFQKLRLGGLRARFWTPQDSFLEGLGSIFRGFGRLIQCLKASYVAHTLGHRQASRSRLRSVRDLAEPQEFVSSKWLLHNQKRQERQERRERQERLPKQDLDHKCAKNGWPAVTPPRGVSIEYVSCKKINK